MGAIHHFCLKNKMTSGLAKIRWNLHPTYDVTTNEGYIFGLESRVVVVLLTEIFWIKRATTIRKRAPPSPSLHVQSFIYSHSYIGSVYFWSRHTHAQSTHDNNLQANWWWWCWRNKTICWPFRITHNIVYSSVSWLRFFSLQSVLFVCLFVCSKNLCKLVSWCWLLSDCCAWKQHDTY